jgi:hypothetical protein
MNAPSRIYDRTSKRMIYPPEMARMGIFISPDGRAIQVKQDAGRIVLLNEVVVMHATGWLDTAKRPIWEGDVVDVDVVHDFGGIQSCTLSRGVVQWEYTSGRYIVNLPEKGLVNGEHQVQNLRVVGDIYSQQLALLP